MLKICFVVANYYPKISKQLISGANKFLITKDIKENKIIYSPGVFEIPTIISKIINDYDGFVALGCVIKGKTPHFDFISKSSIDGIMHLSIKHKKPIGNGIITCLNMKQAVERSDIKKKDKGGEAAKATFSVLQILNNDTK